MPHFSASSREKLATCHHDLQIIFNEIIKFFDCTILEGYRDKDGQDKAYQLGKSKLNYPYGKHNQRPSLAVDVAPYPINWNDTKRFYWFAGFVLGVSCQLRTQGLVSHDLRFGGDWDRDKKINDQSFNDLVHFELVF